MSQDDLQNHRLDAVEDRTAKLEAAMTTVLENQATMNANLASLTTMLSGGLDMMKKGGFGIILLAAAALGVDASGVMM